MDSLQELLHFVQPEQRLDLKAVSLTHILGLTGSEDGKSLILNSPETIQTIVKSTLDKSVTVAKDAILALINLTAEELGAVKVYEAHKQDPRTPNIISVAVQNITKERNDLSDPWCMVLSNLTRPECLVNRILDELETIEDSLPKLVQSFCKMIKNEEGKKLQKGDLHYLGPMFCNLTQTVRGREIFCQQKNNMFERIIPFVNYDENIIRQGGAIGILKNVCFDPAYHDLILTKDSDEFLYCLLFPLAGSEEFTEEENDLFPAQLQYLDIMDGHRKTRIDDPDLRRILLESLLQLCAKKKSREHLRSKGVYEILRELHKWEASDGGDREALLVCEKVVDILIRKEDEIGVDNIKDIEVPTHLIQKFKDDDKDFIEDK